MPTGMFDAADYTVQWAVDQRNIGAINRAHTARLVADSLRTIATLRGDAPRGNDVEVINNPVDFDTLQGVVRLRFAQPTDYADFGALVVETLRGAGFPDAIPHVQVSASAMVDGATSIARSVWSTVTFGLVAPPSTDNPEDGFCEVVVLAAPGINNAVRPALAANTAGAIMAAGSTRQSDDPARNGAIAVSEAASAARNATETAAASFGVPSWLYVVAGVAGASLAALAIIAISFKLKSVTE